MPTLTADSMVARAILAANRPVRSAGAPARAEWMTRHEELEVWYDPQHAFLVTVGCVAMRAVNDQGRFCWLVRQTAEPDALSYVKSPYDVAAARSGGGGLDVPHPAVTELAASLRRGDIRIPLAPTDFGDSSRALRVLAARGLPGWLAAWLMPVLPVLRRAIWAGHRRTLESRAIWLRARALPRLQDPLGAS